MGENALAERIRDKYIREAGVCIYKKPRKFAEVNQLHWAFGSNILSYMQCLYKSLDSLSLDQPCLVINMFSKPTRLRETIGLLSAALQGSTALV